MSIATIEYIQKIKHQARKTKEQRTELKRLITKPSHLKQKNKVLGDYTK
jgi:hypothetical protein